MAASWQKLTTYLKQLDLPVRSRVALPVDHLTTVVGDWPQKANTPTYWAVDMTNPAAYAAAQAGYIFGGFDFGAGGGVSRVQLERIK